jgi:polysaccharide pyruvyl transferase WcaK-like protein
MKKAFFAYQYGRANAGDFAINIGSLDLISEYFDEITILSKTTDAIEFQKDKKYLLNLYDNINILEGPFNLDRTSNYKLLKNYSVGLYKYFSLTYKGIYKKSIINNDIVFLNGGNLFRCSNFTDYIRLYALTFPLKIAKKNNMKYVLLPQSTTSLNKIGKNLLSNYINNAEIMFAREEITYNKLKSHFPEANMLNSLDTAFFIKDRNQFKEIYKKKYSDIIGETLDNITITLRKEDIGDIGELNKEKQSIITKKIEELVESAIQENIKVIFVVQTLKDKEFTEKIYNKFNREKMVNIIEEYDPLVLREIYRNSSCLFGMRLHSIILAMSVGTPVVGYFDQNWGSKNPGTLGQYYMPYTFINERKTLFTLCNTAKNKQELMMAKLEESKKDMKSFLVEKLSLNS